MRPSEIKQTIKNLFHIKRTICIEGPPGVGKTSVVEEAAQELGVGYVVCHLPTMAVEDFGMFMPDHGKNVTRYTVPSWFPSTLRTDMPEEGILCFDDRNQAGVDLQKVLANICQARELHGHKLKPGWMIVSTGNRTSDRAGAVKILTHLRNRETKLDFDSNFDDWKAWAIKKNVHEGVIAFLEFRNDYFNNFDPNADINATPRSWVEGVSDLIPYTPYSLQSETFGGAVGQGVGIEFVQFLNIRNEMPKYGDIVNNPKMKVDTKLDMMYNIVVMLYMNSKYEDIHKIMEFFEDKDVSFKILYVKNVFEKYPERLKADPFFKQWIKENYYLISDNV